MALLWKFAEEVLAMTISLTPAEILDLAKQITSTIQSLTNIDAILDDTRDNLNTVNDLKRRADDAKSASIFLKLFLFSVDGFNIFFSFAIQCDQNLEGFQIFE